jgi:hypothetical protein
MNKIGLCPSLYAHIINGLFLLIAFIMLCKNYTKISSVEPYKLVVLTLIFSIAIGIHGISHLGLEKIYHYNPISVLYN